MTTHTTDGSTARRDISRTDGASPSLTRRRALAAIGALGATFVVAGPASAQAGERLRLEAMSPSGTTLWQAAVSTNANLRQVRNSDGANDTIRDTYHETGERLTILTAYTRNGTDAFVFDGDPRDLRYLAVSYSTGGDPTLRLDGRRIGPFGSWETASPKGTGPGPF